MSSEGIMSKETLLKMSRHCREVAWRVLILHSIPMLGGPGVIVQIDESKFNHKSKVCHCIRKDLYYPYDKTSILFLRLVILVYSTQYVSLIINKCHIVLLTSRTMAAKIIFLKKK